MKYLIKDVKMVIASSSEEKIKDKTIEKLIIDFINEKKAFSLSDVVASEKKFDIHNCINDVAKIAQRRNSYVYDLNKDQVFRFGCKVAIDKMLYKK